MKHEGHLNNISMFCTCMAEETLRIHFTLLLLREELFVVCSGNDTKAINILSGQNKGDCNTEAGGICRYCYGLKV
jgi:hypothetical protein